MLWSCTSCGACVQQCPVDIEHVDHIMDMRRYQVLVESNFPAELNQLFKGLENKGNPWNMSPNARMDWAKGLPFEVKVVGEDVESLDEVDWLFWVGCAGAYEDRAKKTTRAVAELLDMAGVSFGVLGNGETCTGDPARRAGNEFVFQGLAQQNAETFKEYKVKKVVSTCAHCFNTLKNEYKEFGVELEVVHHTQLLNRLVREGKLTPGRRRRRAPRSARSPTTTRATSAATTRSTRRRASCSQVLPGAEFVEMERNSERSFCCGAGGARMWMEENIGERINVNRTKEAVGTGADQIAVGCPFCRVMLSDGLTAQQAPGEAREEVEVLDVAQMLLASVKGEQATKAARSGARRCAGRGRCCRRGAAAGGTATDVATKAEPEAGDVTVTEDTVTETEDVGPAAKASGGSSLFDTPAAEEPAARAAEPASSGSLFDTPAPTEAPAAKADARPRRSRPRRSPAGRSSTPRPRSRRHRRTRRPPRHACRGARRGRSPRPSRRRTSAPVARSSTSAPPSRSPPRRDPAGSHGRARRRRGARPLPRRPPTWAAEARSSTSRLPSRSPPLRQLRSRQPPRPRPADEATTAAPAEEEPGAAVAVESPSDSTPSTPAAPAPQVDLGSGSLFDLPAPEPAAAEPAAAGPEAAVDPESPGDSEASEPAEPSSSSRRRRRSRRLPSRARERYDVDARDGRRPVEPRVAVRPRGARDPAAAQPAASSAPAGAEPAEVESPSDSTSSTPAEAAEPDRQRAGARRARAAGRGPVGTPSGSDLSQAALFRDPDDADGHRREPPSRPSRAGGGPGDRARRGRCRQRARSRGHGGRERRTSDDGGRAEARPPTARLTRRGRMSTSAVRARSSTSDAVRPRGCQAPELVGPCMGRQVQRSPATDR